MGIFDRFSKSKIVKLVEKGAWAHSAELIEYLNQPNNVKYMRKEDIGELIKFLSEVRGSRGADAAYALKKIGEPAVGPLIRALRNSNENVRMGAAVVLGEIGDVGAVEPLIESLKDRNRNVKGAAAMSLGKLDDVRAIEPLNKTSRSKDSMIAKEARKSLKKVRKASKEY